MLESSNRGALCCLRISKRACRLRLMNGLDKERSLTLYDVSYATECLQ